MVTETTRENNRPNPTTVERNDSVSPAATTRETPDLEVGRKPTLINLPATLASRYQIEEQLPTRGVEADLFVTLDRESNTKRVIKLYRYKFRPKSETMELMQTLDSLFVIRQFEHGFSDGHAYEVMEWAEGGSLADLMQPGHPFSQAQLFDVICQLHQAISYLHQLPNPLVHRDLKPDNILVRQREPLQLVLGDFSFASLLVGGSRVATTKDRTILYAALEAAEGDISKAADWWSFGMIIAELSMGRHPFADCEEQAVRIHLNNRKPLPLDGISDPNIKKLCQGLLVYDQKLRWGANEIQRWLDSDSTLHVPVESLPERGNERGGELRASRPYLVGNDECWTAQELAVALCGQWDVACRDIQRYNMLHDWLKDQLGHQNAVRYLEDISEIPENRQVDSGVFVCMLLTILSPNQPLMFEGSELTPQRLVDPVSASRWQANGTLAQFWLYAARELSAHPKAAWLKQAYVAWSEASKEIDEIDGLLLGKYLDFRFSSLDKSGLVPFIINCQLDPKMPLRLSKETEQFLKSLKHPDMHWRSLLKNQDGGRIPLFRRPILLGLGTIWLFEARKQELLSINSQLKEKLKQIWIGRLPKVAIVGYGFYFMTSCVAVKEYFFESAPFTPFSNESIDSAKRYGEIPTVERSFLEKVFHFDAPVTARTKAKATQGLVHKQSIEAEKPLGKSYGYCHKLVIKNQDTSSICGDFIYWDSSWSWQKNFPKSPSSSIVFFVSQGKSTQRRIGFSLDLKGRYNIDDKKAEVPLNFVWMQGENDNESTLLPVDGACVFQRLDTSNPAVLCNAKSKTPSKDNYEAYFQYNENTDPSSLCKQLRLDKGLAKTKTANDFFCGNWKGELKKLLIFFENPDGHCADPQIRASDDLCRVVD